MGHTGYHQGTCRCAFLLEAPGETPFSCLSGFQGPRIPWLVGPPSIFQARRAASWNLSLSDPCSHCHLFSSDCDPPVSLVSSLSWWRWLTRLTQAPLPASRSFMQSHLQRSFCHVRPHSLRFWGCTSSGAIAVSTTGRKLCLGRPCPRSHADMEHLGLEPQCVRLPGLPMWVRVSISFCNEALPLSSYQEPAPHKPTGGPANCPGCLKGSHVADINSWVVGQLQS